MKRFGFFTARDIQGGPRLAQLLRKSDNKKPLVEPTWKKWIIKWLEKIK